MRVFTCAALLGCGAALSSAVHAQQPPAELTTFLQQRIGLDRAQLASIERGDAIVKILDTENKRDVAVFGIIAVDVPRESYVARLQDLPSSLRTPTRARFGIFHVPATAADVESATVAAQDVADVKHCRPGDCKIKMPATDMQRLHAEIDWSAADAGNQLDAYVRRRLVEYVTDYRTRGDSAMLVYDDRGGVHASDAFAALLTQSPYVYQDIPSLRQYLAEYPHAPLDGARELLFWADDSMSGVRPILSVTHMVVYTPPELSGVTVVASKQIFANHFFEGAFDLMAIIDRASTGAKPGSYLVLLRRCRFDNLPTAPINMRGKLVGKLGDQMRVDLERQRVR
ncbi:MAG: hypothetical protein DMD54_00425 [Gemmatimonadetes bacterium]|nr:MAG: hypothetical protein DMD54_00425 [Gemmatimonadota bacterium]